MLLRSRMLCWRIGSQQTVVQMREVDLRTSALELQRRLVVRMRRLNLATEDAQMQILGALPQLGDERLFHALGHDLGHAAVLGLLDVLRRYACQSRHRAALLGRGCRIAAHETGGGGGSRLAARHDLLALRHEIRVRALLAVEVPRGDLRERRLEAVRVVFSVAAVTEQDAVTVLVQSADVTARALGVWASCVLQTACQSSPRRGRGGRLTYINGLGLARAARDVAGRGRPHELCRHESVSRTQEQPRAAPRDTPEGPIATQSWATDGLLSGSSRPRKKQNCAQLCMGNLGGWTSPRLVLDNNQCWSSGVFEPRSSLLLDADYHICCFDLMFV